MVQVGRALGADHLDRHFESDRRVDAAVTTVVVLVVGLQHRDLVAEEPGRSCPAVCDQGLGRGQLQLEVLVQEPPHHVLDLLGLPPGASEAQQPVVGVTAVAQPPVPGIVGSRDGMVFICRRS